MVKVWKERVSWKKIFFNGATPTSFGLSRSPAEQGPVKGFYFLLVHVFPAGLASLPIRKTLGPCSEIKSCGSGAFDMKIKTTEPPYRSPNLHRAATFYP
jgi:hypothetical protein